MNRNIMYSLNSSFRELEVQIKKLNSAKMKNKLDEWETGNSNREPPKLRNRINSFALDLIIVISVLSVLTWFFY